MSPPDYTAFKALSFDVYGTLIDQFGGYWTGLQPLLSRLPPTSPYSPPTKPLIFPLLHTHELHLEQTHPTLSYPEILARAYTLVAADLGVTTTAEEATAFGRSQGSWPAFEDTVEALKSLGRRYKLIILSNTSEEMIGRTLAGPLEGAGFDAVFTAERIGSYKPDLRNFEYLVGEAGKKFGVTKEEILHVAHSLEHDHVPVKTFGLHPGVWIKRGEGEKEKAVFGDRIGLGIEFETLGDFAEAVEKAFGEA